MPRPRRRSSLKRRTFKIEWSEDALGRFILHRQVDGKRLHYSWPNKVAVEKEVLGWLKLHEHRIDPMQVLGWAVGKAITDVPINIGPAGIITCRKFVNEILPGVMNKRGLPRRQLPGWRRENQRIRQLLKIAPFVDKSMHEITEEELMQLVNNYETGVGIKSVNTRHKMRLLVRTIFGSAKKMKYLLEDTAKSIVLPPIPLLQGRRHVSLNEAARVDAKSEMNLKLRIRLGVYAGLEPFEQARLQNHDVDLQQRLLHPRGSDMKRLPREIWIHDELLPLLKKFAVGNPGDLIFQKADGSAPIYPYRALRRAARKAGVIGSTPLSFRHLFRTMLRNASVPNDTAEYLMGHRVGMARNYGSIQITANEKAITSLPKLPKVL
jgi:integrase